MSPTKARIIQYVIIITILTLASGAGYAWYSTRAAISSKAATNNGLVGYWSFDEGTGTQAGDASGNGNTGTLVVGTNWVDGKLKKALNFPGAGTQVTVPSSSLFNIGTTTTYSAWFKLSAMPGGDFRIIRKWTNSFEDKSLSVHSDGKVKFFLYGASGSDVATNSSVSVGKWYHVVGTYDGTTEKIYLNGVLENSISASGDVSDASGLLCIGGDQEGASNSFQGDLDEPRVYNRALTATEITNLYNLGAAKVNTSSNSNLTNGLVGLWSFDGKDISGTTAYDRSGQGNNGTLTNGPTVIPGKLGQALSFWPNGSDTNAYVNIGDPGSGALDFGSGDFAVGFWMKSSGYVSQGSAGNYPISKRNNDAAGCIGYALFYSSTNQMIFSMGNGTTCYTITAAMATTSDAQWHHYFGIRSGNTAYLYIDGVLNGSAAVSGSVSSSASLVVGSDDLPARNINGSIDDVRIYSRALSEGEIRDLYQLGASDKINSADAQTDPLEKGLTGYWKLDENTGTTAADASGNSNTSTLTNGPTWGTGRIGSGVTFDGTNDYLNTSALSLFTNTFTVSFWAKMSSSVGDDYIFDYRTGTSLVAFRSSAGANDIYLRDASGNTPSGGQVSPGFLYDGNWHMYSITADGSNARAFRDGVQQGVERAWTYSIATGSVLTVGSSFGGGYEYFNGSVDEVRAYNRALSSEELAKLYQTTTPDNPDTSLKGYWSFDGPDVSGTTAYDRSGSGASGTLTNGPTVIPGKLGQALNFDGTDDYITAAVYSSGIASLTQTSVSFWINPRVFLYRAIFSPLNTDNGGNGSFDNGFQISSDIWNGTTSVRLASGTMQVHSNTSLSLNTWTHVTVTWDGIYNGTGVKFYFNGVDVGKTVDVSGGGGSYTPGDGRYRIGSGSGGNAFLNGMLDELRVYNRVLTATEVANLYNQSR